jgi:hypothetical protein
MTTTRSFLSWKQLYALVYVFAAPALLWGAYAIWAQGVRVVDGRHDLRTNGIWIQHGWLGDDDWFARNKRDKSQFRNDRKIMELARLFKAHGIRYVFPHLCPTDAKGYIPPVDKAQTERFIFHFRGHKVLPWVGGVWNKHCFPASSEWRKNFIASALRLVESYPEFAGVHVNIEPLYSGDGHLLILLEELRQALPHGKLISVAGFPPPTLWNPFIDPSWDEDYVRKVAKRADQIAFMMYDTAIPLQKVYQNVMANWTCEVLNWASGSKALLGVPVYDDAGVGYHHPRVENLQNSLLGIHDGLMRFDALPESYEGIAIYCEWEMDEGEWRQLKLEFGKK